jgi:hypothetical protein
VPELPELVVYAEALACRVVGERLERLRREAGCSRASGRARSKSWKNAGRRTTAVTQRAAIP